MVSVKIIETFLSLCRDNEMVLRHADEIRLVKLASIDNCRILNKGVVSKSIVATDLRSILREIPTFPPTSNFITKIDRNQNCCNVIFRFTP